jgi:predicted NBD/HSP70 family sugar kinase
MAFEVERTLTGQLLTPSDIGDVNRSRVIQAFCDHGPLTRAQLAKMAGVTRATIGNIVAGLLEAGLVEEGAPKGTEGQVGKPGRPLWFGPRAGLSGAVAIGAGRVEGALVNARGEILQHNERSFDAAEPTGKAVIDAVGTTLRSVLPKAADDILGIGIAVPGTCDTATGFILGSGQVPGLQGTALADETGTRFGLRVLLDNDSRAQALGEKWFGRGRQLRSFASIQTGHGIGVGLVIGGVVLRGPHGEAGEAGHTTVSIDGERCVCGKRGCWETIATLGWLRAEAAKRGVAGAASLDARTLAADVENGNGSDDLLRDYAGNIAVGLANLAHILSLGSFVLHGDAVGGGEAFRALVEEQTKAHVFAHVRDSVEVVLSELDQRAGLLGAAGLVLSETFHLAV